jgi:hypothetical protein
MLVAALQGEVARLRERVEAVERRQAEPGRAPLGFAPAPAREAPSGAEERLAIQVAPPPAGRVDPSPGPSEADWRLACRWVRGDLHDTLDPERQTAILEETWRLQDGYGAPGATPPQGWDWSGIRDSSDAAKGRIVGLVRAMLAGWGFAFDGNARIEPKAEPRKPAPATGTKLGKCPACGRYAILAAHKCAK